MNNKLKNITSNLIGLGVIALGTVMYLENENLYNFLTLLGVGLACFLFKVSETKSWLNKFLGNASKQGSCNHQISRGEVMKADTIGDNTPPDKEQK